VKEIEDRMLAVRIKPGFGCSGGTLLSQQRKVINLVVREVLKWNIGKRRKDKKKVLAVEESHISRDARFILCWRPAQPAKQGIISVSERLLKINRLLG
jgi:hypothetical protein